MTLRNARTRLNATWLAATVAVALALVVASVGTSSYAQEGGDGSAAGAATTLSIESLEMEVGDFGPVALSFSAVPEPGLGNWTLDVSYNRQILRAVSCIAALGGNCTVTFTATESRITGMSESGVVGPSNLGIVTYECVANGTSPLEIKVTTFADATAETPNDIAPAVVDGEVVCTGGEPIIYGDASCNGTVDPVDAALILQWWAGLFSELQCPVTADANADGTVTIIDATLILQLHAGLLASLPP